MLGLQNLTFKNEFCRSHRPNSSKSEIFDLLALTFKVPNLRDFVTIVTVAFFAHWTCSLICLQWCCYMGRNVGEYRSLTSFCVGPRLPHSFLNFLLTVIPTMMVQVLKQSANRAIILAKNLSYAPRTGFPHFLETLSSSFSMTILHC